MTVYQLLKTYTDKYYTDVVIFEDDETIVAQWEHAEHNHWYMGQLDYFTSVDVNPLERFFKCTVKTFEVCTFSSKKIADDITMPLYTIFITI